MATNDDEWRRKRVEELFGPRLTPGFARDARDAAGQAREEVEPMRRPAPARELPLPPLSSLPPRVPPNFSLSPVPRWRSVWWPLAGIVALFLAAGAGWLARGLGSRDRAEAPATAPFVATPAPRLVETPPPVAPTQPARIEPVPARKPPVETRPPVPEAPAKVVPVLPKSTTLVVPAAKAVAPAVKAVAPTVKAEPGFKPSFNCKRAHANVTRMICGDAELSALDRRLDQAYRTTVAGADAPTIQRVQDGQSDFLNRRGECASSACIADVYRDRIDALAELRDSAVIVPRAVEPQPLPTPRAATRARRSELPVCKGYQFYRPMSPCMVMPRHRNPSPDAR